MPETKEETKIKAPTTKPRSRLGAIHIGIGKERNYLVENLSMLIAGGMTILSAIDAVVGEMRSRSMKNILATLRDDIESGSPLWKAFEHSGLFREHTISLVRLGEESGKLSDNLKLIAAQEEKDRSLRSKMRSAMMYPIFVMSLTVIIGVAIAWFILPRLATVFAQLRIELPLLTKWLIGAGEFLGEYGLVVFPIFFAVLGLLIFFLFYFPKTRFIGQAMLFSFPGIKQLLQEVELARFGYLLGTLLQAGVPITQALDSLHSATLFPRYKKLYAHLRDSVQEGNSFHKSFGSYKKCSALIPMPIQQLIVTGEQSGNLSDTLLKISATYEARTENTTKNLTVILEPVLLVIVWLGVVAVALAVILPIYNLIGGLNTDPSQRINEGPAQENVVPPAVSEVPVATSTPEATEVEPTQILRVLETGLGYLNVRDEPSTAGSIIGRALPGEEYEYTGSNVGWYEITLSATTTGWVYEKYVEIIETQTE